MAEIFPFHAYRYNLERVRLASVVTQPYDKITPEMQERYLKSDPHNLIAVEKGKPEPGDSASRNVYTRAEQALQGLIAEGVLVRDAAPGIYVYFQDYTVPGTSTRRTRKGFIALGRVEDYQAGVVFRHEQTLSGPKADRLELLRRTHTHTGQLFMLYKDESGLVDELLDEIARKGKPAEATDEYGVVHRLWPIFEPAAIEALQHSLADKKLVIADGHHRYETALAYRNERRAAAGRTDPGVPFEKAMMTFFDTRGPGLLILPTHRVVAHLPSFDPQALRSEMAVAFEQETRPLEATADRATAAERLRQDLAKRGAVRPTIGMVARGAITFFTLREGADLAALLPSVSPAQRHLDLVLLHRLLLEKGLGISAEAVATERNITYEREMPAAIAAVEEGRAQAAFLLNAIGVDQVTKIALAGEVLPQKSTDFYPKLLSGLTLYRLE